MRRARKPHAHDLRGARRDGDVLAGHRSVPAGCDEPVGQGAAIGRGVVEHSGRGHLAAQPPGRAVQPPVEPDRGEPVVRAHAVDLVAQPLGRRMACGTARYWNECQKHEHRHAEKHA